MNKMENTRKNNTIVLLEEWNKNDSNDNFYRLGIIIESINLLIECKDIVHELKIKN